MKTVLITTMSSFIRRSNRLASKRQQDQDVLRSIQLQQQQKQKQQKILQPASSGSDETEEEQINNLTQSDDDIYEDETQSDDDIDDRYTIEKNEDDEEYNEYLNNLNNQQNPSSNANIIIKPNFKTFWITLFVAMTIAVAINMVCIWLVIVSWNRNNDLNHQMNILSQNIKNQSEGAESCISCDYNPITSQYTANIKGIMSLNADSKIITQFKNEGINIDNVLFKLDSLLSNNVSTSFLFENDLGASNMLISQSPGFITVPTAKDLTGFTNSICDYSTAFVPYIYVFNNNAGSNFLCLCSLGNPLCHILQ